MRITKSVKNQNPVSAKVTNFTVEDGRITRVPFETVDISSFAAVLSRDVGLDVARANDQILVQALDSPADFIATRGVLMNKLANAAAEAANTISEAILTAVPYFPLSILDDIGRSIGSQVLSTAIKGVDDQIGGVNSMVVKKLQTV